MFDDAGAFAEGLPCAEEFRFGIGVGGKADFALASAVVAAGGGFAEAASAEGGDGVAEVFEGADGAEVAEREVVVAEPVFSG